MDLSETMIAETRQRSEAKVKGGTRRGICQLHPVDAARLSGQLFSEVRAAERPCAKYQQ